MLFFVFELTANGSLMNYIHRETEFSISEAANQYCKLGTVNKMRKILEKCFCVKLNFSLQLPTSTTTIIPLKQVIVWSLQIAIGLEYLHMKQVKPCGKDGGTGIVNFNSTK